VNYQTYPPAQKYKNTFTLLGKTFSNGIYIIEIELTVVFEAFRIFCEILSVCLYCRYIDTERVKSQEVYKKTLFDNWSQEFRLLLKNTVEIRCPRIINLDINQSKRKLQSSCCQRLRNSTKPFSNIGIAVAVWYHVPGIRARIYEHLRSPGIDSKESIPPAFP
jgi:hypothetical protein